MISDPVMRGRSRRVLLPAAELRVCDLLVRFSVQRPNDQGTLVDRKRGLRLRRPTTPVDGAAPHVVLFRPATIDTDARGKKMALTLARGGYRVTVLAPSPDDVVHEGVLGPCVVRLVPVAYDLRDARAARMSRRRGRFTFRATDRRAGWTRRRLIPVPSALAALRFWHEAQGFVDNTVRFGWRGWTAAVQRLTFMVDEERALPELADHKRVFGPELVALRPDVIHAHDPKVLGAAMWAARALRQAGSDVRVVYDARENFAGLPPRQRGTRRRHAAILKHERRYARQANAVLTVAGPIAEALQQRLHLQERPVVVLNVPVLRERRAVERDVRADAGVQHDQPVLVYSGGLHWARGIGVLVDGLAALPEVHLAIVTVPFPHPMVPGLLARADEIGVAERLHVLPPVAQDMLLDYLASATIGVHPLDAGSPNHDMALPNKLFEYLHAGLPLVVSDARTMAQFVTKYHLGAVFQTGDAADFAQAVRNVLAGKFPIADGGQRRELIVRFSWQQQEPVVWNAYAAVTGWPVPDCTQDEFPSLDVRPNSITRADAQR